jgi:hypothetical protein
MGVDYEFIIQGIKDQIEEYRMIGAFSSDGIREQKIPGKWAGHQFTMIITSPINAD